MNNYIDDIHNLNENYEMIDISIQKADKYLTSKKRIQEFLDTPVKVYEKLDGIKVNLYHIDKTGVPESDWVVSYKNQIIYSKEFEYLSDIQIKNSSINNSQFKFIFDHLRTIDSKSIPKNYEFFIEYLMKKPTLSSNYNVNHQMILLACSPSKIEINMGRVKSRGSFDISKREEFAKKLGIDTPPFIFDGKLRDFEAGCKHPKLLELYNQRKFQIHSDETMVSTLTDIFLQLNSKYGNTPEGYVLDFGNLILKIQQPYQTDQNARAEIKNQYRMTPDEENRYWDQVRLQALTIVNKLKRPFKAINLNDILGQAAQEIKKIPNNDVPVHQKKNKVQVLDDIQGNVKMIVLKQLQGNNNALFLGKMRILTKAHYDIINKASKTYDKVVVCLVTGSDTKFSQKLRLKMLKTAFGGNQNVEIIEHSNGNLFTIMNKASANINVVLCGTDRLNDYKNMLSRNPDIKVVETQRPSGAVSATFVIKNLNNEMIFKSNTPKEIHGMYNEILKFYKKNTPDDIDINENYVYYDETEEYVTRLIEKHSFKNIDIDGLFDVKLDEHFLFEDIDYEELVSQAFLRFESLNEASKTSYNKTPEEALKNKSLDEDSRKILEYVKDALSGVTNLRIAVPDVDKIESIKIGRACYIDAMKKLNLNYKIGRNQLTLDGNKITLIMGNGSIKGSKGDGLNHSTYYQEMGVPLMAMLLLVAGNKLISLQGDIDEFCENAYDILSRINLNKHIEGTGDANEDARMILLLDSADESWFKSNLKNGATLANIMKNLKSIHIWHENSANGRLVKNKGAELTGLEGNKWNPADIFLVSKNTDISKIKNCDNILKLNYMFGAVEGDKLKEKTLIGDDIVERVGCSISLKKEANEALSGSIALKSLENIDGVDLDSSDPSEITTADTLKSRCQAILNYVGNISYSHGKIIYKTGERSTSSSISSVDDFYACCKKKNRPEKKPQAKTEENVWWLYYPRVLSALKNITDKPKELNDRMLKTVQIAASQTPVSCTHYKLMGETFSIINKDVSDHTLELRDLYISLNGDVDIYFMIKFDNKDFKLQLRSKGLSSPPQFMLVPPGR